MATKTLQLDEEEYILVLGAVRELPIAYYVGHIGINQPMYGRGERVDALVFTKDDIIDIIDDFRDAEWPCWSEPPITIRY